MSNERIKQIDKEIEKLQAEKQRLEEIERMPELQRKIKRYLNDTYSGKRLMEKHSLDEVGFWKVLGEDPNCDLGGYHHQPELGIIKGTLQQALEFGLNHSDFYSWGGGGDFRKLEIIVKS
jgi:hypothetical protein